jgi:nucleotide-binding universal stress UspA family protein
VIEFKQIICPVDFSESSVRALAYAAAFAGWYDAQLTGLHVVPTFEPMQVRGDLAEPVRVVTPMPREQVVEEMSRSLNLAALSSRTTPIAESGDPQATIIDQALSKKADLIVMGTHGRRGFKRLLLGSVAEAVLREAPCPVLTVPPHASANVPEAVAFKRILCPIDFSPSALQGLGFALDLARQADGRVTLLHVVEWLTELEPRASLHFNVPEYRRYMVEDAQERLRNLVAEESRTWVEIGDVVMFGRAYREILRAAEARPADLIVMGAQGRGGIGLALFGSTTQQVVRGAICPVMTVRGLPQ